MPPKTMTVCNWVPSIVTDDTLKDFVTIGYLPEKSIMSYRTPDPAEERPQPKDGEVIIFTDHMNWGFHRPTQNSLEMFCIFSSFIHKILDPSPYPISAIFKFSVRFIFKKNLPLNSSESISI